MALILMKSNLTSALVACARECANLIEWATKEEPTKSHSLIDKGKQCRAASVECLEAYEATHVAIRGLLLHSVRHACTSLLKECGRAKYQAIDRCMEACRECIDACECLMDDRDFGVFPTLGNPPLRVR